MTLENEQPKLVHSYIKKKNRFHWYSGHIGMSHQ